MWHWGFTDSWDNHLFRVLPLHLVAASLSQSSVSFPSRVCTQVVMGEGSSLQQMGPLLALWPFWGHMVL